MKPRRNRIHPVPVIRAARRPLSPRKHTKLQSAESCIWSSPGKTVTVTAISKADGKVITTAKIKILKNAVTGIKVKNAPKTLKAGKSIRIKIRIN